MLENSTLFKKAVKVIYIRARLLSIDYATA